MSGRSVNGLNYERRNNQMNDNIQYLQDRNLPVTGMQYRNMRMETGDRYNQSQQINTLKAFAKKTSENESDDRKVEQTSSELRKTTGTQLNPSNNPNSKSGNNNSGPAVTSNGIPSYSNAGSTPSGS